MELNTQQVADALDVSYSTVLNYIARVDDPLPVEVGQRGLYRERVFDSTQVIEWARRHKLVVKLEE